MSGRAPGKKSGAGAVYMFQRVGTAWVQKTAIPGAAGSRLGSAVDVYSNTALVGTPGATPPTSTPRRVAAGPSRRPSPTPAPRALEVSLGPRFRSRADAAVIGAWNSFFGKGSARIYAISGTTWSHQQDLHGAASSDNFGFAVDVNGDLVAVGAPAVNGGKGAVYTYRRSGNTWGDQKQLEVGASVAVAGDKFGAAVSLDGPALLVGRRAETARRGRLLPIA